MLSGASCAFIVLQLSVPVAAAPIVQLGAEAQLRTKELDRNGLQFGRLAHPVQLQGCERGTEILGKEIFVEGGRISVLRNYRCSGRNQYWLIKPVDQSGKHLTRRAFERKLDRAEDDNEYVIDDVFLPPKLSKGYTLFSQGCMRDDHEIPSLAFAIGTTEPIYEGNGPERPGEEIGYKSKEIAAAWRINVQMGKFEPMRTKGLSCSYAD